jgi:predicted alpha/beta-hydrolase family hydrolase
MSSDTLQWRIPVGKREIEALFEVPTRGDCGIIFVCAHGAGGHMADRGIQAVTAELRNRGIGTVRFNFLYRQYGSSRPDRMPDLMRCMAAVVEHTREALRPRTLLIGGRSMGGRTASMLAAQGLACDALLLLAYPLHPAGQPEKLRDAHWRQIHRPVLCLNGTRDALCQRDIMERVLTGAGSHWQMHWLEGADHSFRVLKSSGRTADDVLEEVGSVTECWLSNLYHAA